MYRSRDGIDDMAEKDKTNALKARLPRGLVDRHAGAIKSADRMIATIRGVYEIGRAHV